MQVQSPEPVAAPPAPNIASAILGPAGSRRALAGFYVSGILAGIPRARFYCPGNIISPLLTTSSLSISSV